MTLAELILQFRKEHNLSQRQMAADCCLSAGYISLIEKEINPQTGKRMVPTLSVLNKLARGMGMTIDDLLAACEDMPVELSGAARARELPNAAQGSELDRALEGIDFALYGEVKDLTDAQKRDVLQFVKFLKSRG